MKTTKAADLLKQAIDASNAPAPAPVPEGCYAVPPGNDVLITHPASYPEWGYVVEIFKSTDGSCTTKVDSAMMVLAAAPAQAEARCPEFTAPLRTRSSAKFAPDVPALSNLYNCAH